MYAIGYYLINILNLIAIAYLFFTNYGAANFSMEKGFSYLAYGIAIAFTLVPLHEYIHVLAYRSQGAANTSYDAQIKKFIFMAIADRFVANKKEFTIVALAPFVLITGTLIIALFIAGLYGQFLVLGILFTHTACCSGDFGLMSFFEYNKRKKPVTYDDVVNKVSYFYGENV